MPDESRPAGLASARSDPPTPATLTIVIPTYNRRDTVAALAESVAGQLRPGDELVVSDDASTDGTADAVRAVAGATVVRHEQNLGMVGNWNYCLTAGTKDWICLLHDDDRLRPGGLETLRRACTLADGPALVAHGVWQSRATDDPTGGFCYEAREAGRVASLNAEFCPSGLTLHRAVPAAVGTFRHDYPYSADMEFFARVCARFPSIVVLNPGVIDYVMHGDNYQMRTWRKPDFLPQLRAVEAESLRYAGLSAADADRRLRARLSRDLLHMLATAKAAGDREVVKMASRELRRLGGQPRRRQAGLWLAATLGRVPGRLIR